MFDMAVFQYAQEHDGVRATRQISFSTQGRVRRDLLDPNKVLLWVAGSCILAISLLIGIPALAMMIANGDKDDDDSSQLADRNNEAGKGGKSGEGENKKKNKDRPKKGKRNQQKKKKTRED